MSDRQRSDRKKAIFNIYFSPERLINENKTSMARQSCYICFGFFSAAKCMARVGAEAKWRKKWNKLCMHNMRLKLAVIILMVVNFHRIPNTKVNKTHRTRKLLCFYNCWHFAYLLVLHIKWPHTSILIKPFRAQFWFFCSLCLIVFFLLWCVFCLNCFFFVLFAD